MAWKTIEETRHDEGILRISLDRPDRSNAQSLEMLEEFDEAIRSAEGDDAVRVIIIDGNGPHFSVGHEVTEDILAERTREWTIEDFLAVEQEYYYEPCRRLQSIDRPTIAQVHGYCGTAGMMLAAMCDLIVATEDAEFENPTYQMAAAGGEMFYEPWDLGMRKAKELLWTGGSLSGRDAAELGLVNRAVPEDDLYEETMVLATKIARMPPFAIKLSKKSFEFTAEQMGRNASYKYHMLVHQMQHASQEYRDQREEALEMIDDDGLAGWVGRRRATFDVERDFDEPE